MAAAAGPSLEVIDLQPDGGDLDASTRDALPTVVVVSAAIASNLSRSPMAGCRCG